MRVWGAFSASEELAQKVVEDLAGYFDDVLVSRDSQLGFVILRQHTALDDHGVAIGDDDSRAQAVAAAPRRVVVDDFHHPILAHLFRGSVQSNSVKVATSGHWHENLRVLNGWVGYQGALTQRQLPLPTEMRRHGLNTLFQSFPIETDRLGALGLKRLLDLC